MVLDEGYFVAASNAAKGIEYDFDNAIQFVYDDDLMLMLLLLVRRQRSWVNEVMISTVRGNDAAFKGATLKPLGTSQNDPEEWLDYTESSLARLNFPLLVYGRSTLTTNTSRWPSRCLKVKKIKSPSKSILTQQ